MNKKPVIKKIKFTKEQQEEIDLINKGEAFNTVKTKIYKNGVKRDIIFKRRFTYETGHKRLVQLYGGKCRCGNWPSYKILYDYGTASQGAWLVERYCDKCFGKNGSLNKK